MATLLQKLRGGIDVPEAVRLDLSGPILTNAFQTLITGCEPLGGIERYIETLKLKSKMFADALIDGKAEDLDLDTFMGLSTFMATVRRRIAPYLDPAGFATIKSAVTELLADAQATAATDQRWDAFCARFPVDRKHRWVRDLAAEILHNSDPERYPLMCRWVWDAKANTGVIREIWHGDNVDHMTIPVPDGYETYMELRRELAQFLTANGIFRDNLQYADLLSAHVYANYISAQGGSYLKADFTSADDPMEHTRRILGLDGVKPGSTRTRLKSIDGQAFVLDDVKHLG